MRALIVRIGGLALLAVVVTLAGCATNGQLLPDPEQNAALKEELAGQRFGGRWWDLYARAAIYQKYGLVELAEQDLRAAMNLRPDDQRWARTYGLHFMPEYFPNRELGIVLLEQDRVEEAAQHLEQSIGALYTARAAHYLDEAHAERVALASLDQTPPSIELTSPAQGGVVAGTHVDLRAIARDDSYVAAVKVNGEPVPLLLAATEVPLEQTVALEPGANSIEIEVTDILGNSTVESFSFQRDSDGPAVSFDTPLVLPGTIRGVAFDPSSVQAMFIGDAPAVLSKGANGETTFEFAVARVSAEFVPEFRCEDALGNSTTGLLPLDAVRTQASRGDTAFASTPNVVQLNREIAAVYKDGELFAVVRTAANEPISGAPRIQFTNLLDGQRYLKDEVVVSLEVESAETVRTVSINGEPIESIVPGRGTQRISRKINIEAEGEHRIAATVTDALGATSSAEVLIERQLPQVEAVSARLSIALLGDLAQTGDASLQDQAEYVRSQLPFTLDELGRFNVVDRDSIETVIEEQQLVAALGSVKERQRLGQLDMADYLLIADLRRYADNIEVVLHAIDSITSSEVIVDVYGPGNSAQELRELLDDLALRLEQEFPRVRGNLVDVAANGERVFSSLSRTDRVRESMYCVVYRPQEVIDPKTNASLGTELIPIAEGTLRDIQRQGSSIQLLLNDADQAAGAPQLNDLVVTK